MSDTEPIRQYGDPVLRQRCRAIRKINAGVRELACRMAAAMYAANGIGLAAPQIGESRRIVVLDAGDGLITLINPRLIQGEGQITDVEACLSVRGLCGEVTRFERVRVRARDLEGKESTLDCEDLLARAVQHEMDHLDGVLFVDRAINLRAIDPPAGDETSEAEEDPDAEAPADQSESPPPVAPGDGPR